ncbi:MAG: DUF4055 domain-containing protein [Eubacteriales bacterium]|nr:DUF4055 domain-containing protein [Eubacteriales bacterium]
MPINTKCDEYNKWSFIWKKTRDGIEGQEVVKKNRETYLPMLNGQTPESYNAYLKRAMYVNFSSRTMSASLGQLFRKNPIIKDVDDDILDNINLAGSSFNYFFKNIAKEIMAVNRVGILLDYSVDQLRPYLTSYQSESIINWRVEIIEGIEKLSMVILEGEKNVIDTKDKYKIKQVNVWKELFLDGNVYKVQNWIKNDKDEFVFDGDEIIPLINGKVFNYIPFYILTSNGITHKITKSSMVDFVNLNYGHYVNTADYENMLHWTGAKTVITRGWGDKAFPIGGAADFPIEGGAVFLEASSDSGLKEELRHKEEQMAALGSQIISGKGRYVASAETSRISSEGEYATLSDISKSLSDSASLIMSDLNAWSGKNQMAEIEFNTDFEVEKIPQGKLIELMGAVQSGFMSMETFYYQLKSYEVYPVNWSYDDEIKAIEESMQKQVVNREETINNSDQKIEKQDEIKKNDIFMFNNNLMNQRIEK